MKAAKRNAIIEAKTGRPVPTPPASIVPKYVLHRQRAKAQLLADIMAVRRRVIARFVKREERAA